MERLVGKKAPLFDMNTTTGDGSKFLKVNLDDFKGGWLALFFYPLNFTLTCFKEITSFNDIYKDFKDNGCEILGISCDSVYSHRTWIKESLGKINFSLASDMTKKVSSDYNVLIEEEGVPLRSLFIIDPEGVIRYSVIYDINFSLNTLDALNALKSLKSPKK